MNFAARPSFPIVPTMLKTTATEACRVLELEMTGRTLALERSVAEVREESRKAVEAVRQAVAGKAGLADLEVIFSTPNFISFVHPVQVDFSTVMFEGGGGVIGASPFSK